MASEQSQTQAKAVQRQASSDELNAKYGIKIVSSDSYEAARERRETNVSKSAWEAGQRWTGTEAYKRGLVGVDEIDKFRSGGKNVYEVRDSWNNTYMLTDRAIERIQKRYKDSWNDKYWNDAEDQARKAAGLMPRSYSNSYTKYNGDPILRELNLPDTDHLNDYIAEAVEWEKNTEAMYDFYEAASNIGLQLQMKGIENTSAKKYDYNGKNQTGAQIWEQSFFDTLNSDDWADVRHLVQKPETVPTELKPDNYESTSDFEAAKIYLDVTKSAKDAKLDPTSPVIDYDDFKKLYPSFAMSMYDNAIVDSSLDAAVYGGADGVITVRDVIQKNKKIRDAAYEQEVATEVSGLRGKKNVEEYLSENSDMTFDDFLEIVVSSGSSASTAKKARNYFLDKAKSAYMLDVETADDGEKQAITDAYNAEVDSIKAKYSEAVFGNSDERKGMIETGKEMYAERTGNAPEGQSKDGNSGLIDAGFMGRAKKFLVDSSVDLATEFNKQLENHRQTKAEDQFLKELEASADNGYSALTDEEVDSIISNTLLYDNEVLNADSVIAAIDSLFAQGISIEQFGRVAATDLSVPVSTMSYSDQMRVQNYITAASRKKHDNNLSGRIEISKDKMSDLGLTSFEYYNMLRRNDREGLIDQEDYARSYFSEVEFAQAVESNDAMRASLNWDYLSEEQRIAVADKYWNENVTGDKRDEYINGFIEGQKSNPYIHKPKLEQINEQFGLFFEHISERTFYNIASSAIGFADMATAKMQGRTEQWGVTKDLSQQAAKANSLGKSSEQDVGSTAIGYSSDIAAELMRMYTINSIGSVVGGVAADATEKAIGGIIGQSAKASAGAGKIIKAASDLASTSAFVIPAMGAGYNEAIGNGATIRQATQYGVFTGLVEGVTEKLNVESWVSGGFGSKRYAKNLMSGLSKYSTSGYKAKVIAGQLLSSFLGEATEEGISYGAGLWATRFTGIDSDAEFSAAQLSQEMLLGGIVGLFGAGMSVGNAVYGAPMQYMANHGWDADTFDIMFAEAYADMNLTTEERAQYSKSGTVMSYKTYTQTLNGMEDAARTMRNGEKNFAESVAVYDAEIASREELAANISKQIESAMEQGDYRAMNVLSARQAEVLAGITEAKKKRNGVKASRAALNKQMQAAISKGRTELNGHYVALANLFQGEIAAYRDMNIAEMQRARAEGEITVLSDKIDALYAPGIFLDNAQFDELDSYTNEYVDAEEALSATDSLSDMDIGERANTVMGLSNGPLRKASRYYRAGGSASDAIERGDVGARMNALMGISDNNISGKQRYASVNASEAMSMLLNASTPQSVDAATIERAKLILSQVDGKIQSARAGTIDQYLAEREAAAQEVRDALAQRDAANEAMLTDKTKADHYNEISVEEENRILEQARKLGVSVIVENFDDDNDRGFYVTSDGVLHINRNQPVNAKGEFLHDSPGMYVFKHEFTHWLQKSADYDAYAKIVLDIIKQNNPDFDFDAYKANKEETLVAHGKKFGKNTALHELVAEFTQAHMFTDSDSISSVVRENAGLAGRMLNKIQFSIAENKLRKSGTPEAKAMLKAEKMYVKSFRDAKKQRNAGLKAEKTEEAEYSKGSKRYDDSYLDNVARVQYDKYAWARINNVISAQEKSDLDAKIGDSKVSGKIPMTADGKFIFAVGSDTGINNVLVVSDGKRGDYSIDRVYRINLEHETLLENVRDAIYGIEAKEHSSSALSFVEGSFGQGLIRVSFIGNVQSYDAFREARSNRAARSNGRKNALNYNIEQNGTGNDRANSPDQSATDSAEVTSSQSTVDADPEIEWSFNSATVDFAIKYTAKDDNDRNQLSVVRDAASKMAQIQSVFNTVGKTEGFTKSSIHNLNQYLAQHKDVWQQLYDLQEASNAAGIPCKFITPVQDELVDVDGEMQRPGLIGMPIEYVHGDAEKGNEFKFRVFLRTIPQMYIDSLDQNARERLRKNLLSSVEVAYASGNEMANPIPNLQDAFPEFAREATDVLGNATRTTIESRTAFYLQSPLRTADKTLMALNLNSACPMFTIGNHGCYLDACYLTQMAHGANGTNLFRSAMYTGEILQLRQEDIDFMNSVGGLRINGVGDTTLDNQAALADAIRHAGMRGLKLKIISKQRGTLDAIKLARDNGANIDGVTVQLSMDNLWIPAELDDAYGAGIRGSVGLANTLKAATKTGDQDRFYAASVAYDEIFGRATKVVDGVMYRKYGFSPEQIRAMQAEYPFVNITPRYVVCTAAEIAEIALNRDGNIVNDGKVIQTLMHGKVPEGCLSDYPGEIINFGSNRHMVEKDANGNWDFYGVAVGKVKGDKTYGSHNRVYQKSKSPYQKVKEYVQANYTPEEQNIIWTNLKNSMCCQDNEFKDACAGCQSLCAGGCACASYKPVESNSAKFETPPSIELPPPTWDDMRSDNDAETDEYSYGNNSFEDLLKMGKPQQKSDNAAPAASAVSVASSPITLSSVPITRAAPATPTAPAAPYTNTTAAPAPQRSIDVNDAWDSTVSDYGVVGQGMNPRAREIDVPRQTTPVNRTSDFLRSALESQHVRDEWMQDVKDAVINDGLGLYVPQKNSAVEKEQKDYIGKNEIIAATETFEKNVRDGNVSDANNVLGMQLLADAQKRGDKEGMRNLVASLCVAATDSGRATQAFSMLKKMGGVGASVYAQKLVARLNSQYAEQIKKGKMNPFTISQEALDQANNAVSMKDIEIASDAIAKEIGQQIPLTVKEQIRSFRYIAMLTNPATYMRNAMGNVMMLGARSAKDAVAAGYERAFVKDKADWRHAVYNPYSKSIKPIVAFAKSEYDLHAEDLRSGGKYGIDVLANKYKRSFNNKTLNAIAEFNAKHLEDYGDVPFLRKNFVDAYTQYMKAQELTPDAITEQQKYEAAEWASLEALRNTFRDASDLADGINALARKSKAAGFILDAAMPFRKTPINIAKRGIDYSPAGLIEASYMLVSDLVRSKNGIDTKYTPSQIVDRFAAGTVGAALTAVGFFLAKSGILRGKGDEED